MKTFLTILLIYLISSTVHAQEISKLNFGIGYPFFIPKKNYSNSGGYVFIEKNKLNLFAEIPGLITFKKNPEFKITPGLSYIYFNENKSGAALGGQSYSEYLRSAISVYSKFLFNPELKTSVQNNWNIGLTTGFYLYTHTKGHSEWKYRAGSQYYSGESDTDTDGKSFFKSVYFGITTSFQFNFEKMNYLKPGIEFSFFPWYVNIADSYSGDQTKKNKSENMFMGSLIIGLGSKKQTIQKKLNPSK